MSWRGVPSSLSPTVPTGTPSAARRSPFPVVEVHLSNLHARDGWQRHSLVAQAARATVQGFGWRIYTAALRALVEPLREG
jgi:3-dehydroquinate dehydratase-2